MQAYRIEATVEQDGQLTITNLPLHAGETVEIIILPRTNPIHTSNIYPLRGMPVHYINPFEPIAQDDWGSNE